MAVSNPSDFPQVDEQPQGDELALEMQEKLQMFGATLAKTRDAWVNARATSGVDKRFKEDLDQYHGRDNLNREAPNMMSSVAAGFPIMAANNQQRPTRSSIFIGVSRQKSNAGEARLADIVLPSDDRNFGVDPTPNPQLKRGGEDHNPAMHPETGMVMQGGDGQNLKVSDIAQAAMRAARDAADAMQDQIDDQLTECDFNGECRKMIHDAAVLGTGVMKGPVVISQTHKSWTKQIDATGKSAYVLTMVSDLQPASFRVDPRNLFPDPACGDNIHNGGGMWEYSQKTPKQVRLMAKQPEYLEHQLKVVLTTPPPVTTKFDLTRDSNTQDINVGEVYEHWEYWGEFDGEDLAMCGVDFGDKHPTTLKGISGVIEMLGATVVRAYLNPLEDGGLPYDFLPWEKVSDSVWGFGIPRLMRAQQQVTNSSWRQMMDNAGISSGPQIVLKPGMIGPADKRWEISNRKLWFATNETEDVSKAFTTFSFDSRQADLQNILKLAEMLADQETAVPTMAQGEKGSAPETVGGMQLLMNGSNVVLRRLVKQWDDYFIKPHIRRYYDFNMAYNDDEKIKGDFAVNPRGSTALMIRDIQNQAFTNLMALATNPVFAPMLDPKALFEKALRAQHVDPTDIMRTDEEIKKAQEEAKQNQQPDPRIEAASIRAKADIQREELRQKEGMASIAAKEKAAQMDTNTRIQELYIERDIAMLRVSADQGISLDKIKAMLADTAIRERTKKEIAMGKQAHDLQLQGRNSEASAALARDNQLAQQYAKVKDIQHAHSLEHIRTSLQAQAGLLTNQHELDMQAADHQHEADQQTAELEANQKLQDTAPAPAPASSSE